MPGTADPVGANQRRSVSGPEQEQQYIDLTSGMNPDIAGIDAGIGVAGRRHMVLAECEEQTPGKLPQQFEQ